MVKNNEFESRNLFLYFLITFTFSLLDIIMIYPKLMFDFLYHFPFIRFLAWWTAAFGPFIAAFSLTYLNERKDGIKQLLKRGIDIRFRKVWFIPILLLYPAIYGGALLLMILIEKATPIFLLTNPSTIVNQLLRYIILAIGEEFGWRGYALDRLQARYNAIVSSAILGFFWGIWHWPHFFVSGSPYEGVPFWVFIPLVIPTTILYTWIYNNTEGSILGVTLFHTMNNISATTISYGMLSSIRIYTLILVIVVIVIVIIWRPKRLVLDINK